MTSGGGWAGAFAPAKLNPWLEVLGRRPDGYHELVTFMVALELGDRVAARRTASGRVELRVGGPAASADVPLDGRNLALRGSRIALELATATGLAPAGVGLEVVLEKHVPSQAGLGGASSDAAAALLASAAALGLDLAPGSDRDAARAALAGLGSDCAFFLEADTGAALCTGRGEHVRPLAGPDPPWDVALVVPAVPAPTAAVYAALELGLRPPRRVPDLAAGLLAPPGPSGTWTPYNRLEEAALRAVPELRPWRDLFDRCAPGAFHLSGSGSSFFSLAPDAAAAARALRTVLSEAAARGLAVRGSWLVKTRPAGATLEAPAPNPRRG